jgi:nicotinamide-nucleotide amidase
MAGRLTDRAGSSAYFLGGIVAYSNEAKISLVGVDRASIERFGAVSTEVAEELASGAAARLGAEIGIGITGIAGPGGGTPEKPVGLVCISVCDGESRRLTRSIRMPGGRSDIRDRSVTVSMHLLRGLLMGEGEDTVPGAGVASGADSGVASGADSGIASGADSGVASGTAPQ